MLLAHFYAKQLTLHFNVHTPFIVYIISVHAFSVNQTNDHGIVSSMFELQEVYWNHLSHGQTQHMYRMMKLLAAAATVHVHK